MGKKRNNVNKNKKKNWRKHTDIEDIETFLDDARQQERLGGLKSEKADEELFFVDKSRVTGAEGSKPDVKQKRQLKCELHLQPDPDVRPARIKHNVPKERLKPQKKMTKAQKAALLQGHKARQEALKCEQQRSKLPEATQNLWNDKVEKEEDFIEDAVKHYKTITKQLKIKVPENRHKKPSALPSIEVAHPGASYNPAHDDHQELLRRAYDIEVKKDKKEQKILRSMASKTKITAEELEQAIQKEMSAGLFDDAPAKEETFTAEELDKISLNPAVRRDKKKTPQQRKKEKRNKMKEKRRLEDKQQRIRDNDFNRLKAISREVKRTEMKEAVRVMKKQAKNEAMKTKPKNISNTPYIEPEIDLQLSTELTGSLRSLKPEGNILLDRLKSFEKRNILPPSRKNTQRKKRKAKFYTKQSHKDVE